MIYCTSYYCAAVPKGPRRRRLIVTQISGNTVGNCMYQSIIAMNSDANTFVWVPRQCPPPPPLNIGGGINGQRWNEIQVIQTSPPRPPTSKLVSAKCPISRRNFDRFTAQMVSQFGFNSLLFLLVVSDYHILLVSTLSCTPVHSLSPLSLSRDSTYRAWIQGPGFPRVPASKGRLLPSNFDGSSPSSALVSNFFLRRCALSLFDPLDPLFGHLHPSGSRGSGPLSSVE